MHLPLLTHCCIYERKYYLPGDAIFFPSGKKFGCPCSLCHGWGPCLEETMPHLTGTDSVTNHCGSLFQFGYKEVFHEKSLSRSGITKA